MYLFKYILYTGTQNLTRNYTDNNTVAKVNEFDQQNGKKRSVRTAYIYIYIFVKNIPYDKSAFIKAVYSILGSFVL